jgi:hypothetical protein
LILAGVGLAILVLFNLPYLLMAVIASTFVVAIWALGAVARDRP